MQWHPNPRQSSSDMLEKEYHKETWSLLLKCMTLTSTHSLMSEKRWKIKQHLSLNMVIRVYDLIFTLTQSLYHNRLWCLANLPGENVRISRPLMRSAKCTLKIPGLPVSLFIWQEEFLSSFSRFSSFECGDISASFLPGYPATLVIAVLYKTAASHLKWRGRANKDMSSAIRCKDTWIIYGDEIFADMCKGWIRSRRCAGLLTERSPFSRLVDVVW